MHLSPREIDKLILHNAGFLAQKRYARGLKLNYVETMALISTQLLEFIRDGNSVAELMEKGRALLGLDEVLPGVAEMIAEVQVEGTFPDGTKLVTVHYPISREKGEEVLALYGSGLSRRYPDSAEKDSLGEATIPSPKQPDPFVYNGREQGPGAVFTLDEDLVLNEGRVAVILKVLNRGDRPVQVGSHYPFFETNPALEFDREQAYGKRLDIAAGTAIRFEPGETKEVPLIDIAGERISKGGNNLINGFLDKKKEAALSAMNAQSFNNKEQSHG